jgi:peptide/nickel transport system ATP-binding protein
MDDRCYFADRCPKAMEACLEKPPEFDLDGDGGSPEHAAKCYLAEHPYDESQALPEGYFDEGSEDAGAGAESAAERSANATERREGEADD